MPQVVVRGADLGQQQPPIIVQFSDSDQVTDAIVGAYGNDATVLTVPAQAVTRQAGVSPIPVLAANWRTYADAIVNAEAQRRIVSVFSEYTQRNATVDVTKSLIDHGNDVGVWPSDARDRKAIADTGWSYVNSVRERSNAMLAGALPLDPTDDSHWPTKISPISYPTS